MTTNKVGFSGKVKTSRSTRANLMFPVGRVARLLRRGKYAGKVSEGAGVFMTAALEYLMAEVLELSGNAASENKQRRLTPRHIQLAVRNDAELNNLLQGALVSKGGVLPFINPSLVPKKKVPGAKKLSAKKPPSASKKSGVAKKLSVKPAFAFAAPVVA